MVDWKYNPSNYNEDGHELIPAGDYRVRIDEAAEKISQSGKEMIRLKLKVNGYNTPIWYYVVFDSSSEEARKRTDQRLGSIFDSFQIERGTLNPQDWEGKIGGARLKNSTDANGDMRSEVHYFLSRKKTEILPAFESNEEKAEPKTDVSFGESIGKFGFDMQSSYESGEADDMPF